MINAKQYIGKNFTEHGHMILFRYLKYLIRFSYENKVYPVIRTGRVLDMPDSPWFKHFKNRDELIGQIKMLMNILGFKQVAVKLSDGKQILYRFIEGE